MINKALRYFLENKLITFILLVLLIIWGLIVIPFDWKGMPLPKKPISVDAIPDIGENQQIVFTEWKGRSPQDIQDQITYPLTTALLGIPGVKTIRSSSIFGISSIYIIFDDDIEFYWSRSRIVEKLNSLPQNLLPDDVFPKLGPDATALGQIFWYTIEGRDADSNPTGGWDLHEIRSVQDYLVKYGLNAVDGVSEVASIGGFVQEYQIDINPSLLQSYNISLQDVVKAVQKSNRDVGAKTVEINRVEYIIRGLGYIKSIEDIEQAVIQTSDNVSIRIKDVAKVGLGPAQRRGILDKEGAEVVGGVVVARHGSNPMEVIKNVKAKISEISKGLPKKTLTDGSKSQLTIIPFYDRTQLINETLGTLEYALSLQIIITVIVVVVMISNLRASILISSLLLISILLVFIAMKLFNIDANIVALSGIVIAIGTMVDLGIVMSENMIKRIQSASSKEPLVTTILESASEVSSAITTAVTTTIISFIPVFTLEATEGKLFTPLAYTKTFALIAALLVALFILPSLSHVMLGIGRVKRAQKIAVQLILIISGTLVLIKWSGLIGSLLIWIGLLEITKLFLSESQKLIDRIIHLSSILLVTWFLSSVWLPMGPAFGQFSNYIFISVVLSIILGGFYLLERFYESILKICLRFKWVFLVIPVVLMGIGFQIWKNTGKEFMPSLDEGSFLLMPTSMPHAGIEQNKHILQQLDQRVASIPEIEQVVGKLGRVESALDPAPISMYENVINYKPEFILNDRGKRLRFKVDNEGRFQLRNGNAISNEDAILKNISVDLLIEDENGRFYRNWRKEIQSPDDIWNEIVKMTQFPGVTSAPKLQPIETRLVMLQSGMRAPMGIKVSGPDLKSIESFAVQLENVIKEVEGVKRDAVFADRIVGKPYMQLKIDREKLTEYGLQVEDVQQTIEVAIGGKAITSTVEGRERYPVRIRYPQELRDDVSQLNRVLIKTPNGYQIPLSQILSIEYERGPQMIRSEGTFLVAYVLFDKLQSFSEVEVINRIQQRIDDLIDSSDLIVPQGVSFNFEGNYKNQLRAEKRLSFIIPVVLVLIFLILYIQFRSVAITLMIFLGVLMAFSGAFILIGLYGQHWFLNVDVFGLNLRDIFQIETIHLSVAVWVGFIALFGIATDDGVLMGTYLKQNFKRQHISSVEDIHQAVIQAGKKRIKPAVMTSASTIIALLPVLTSTGKGSDIIIPMAIPAVGGMLFASITYFLVPVLYSIHQEIKLRGRS